MIDVIVNIWRDIGDATLAMMFPLCENSDAREKSHTGWGVHH